jgi:glyoxylase-like metal-dependent hydrolase (beta-lactamase superfamily II)
VTPIDAGGWSAELVEAGQVPMTPADLGSADAFSGITNIPVNVLLLRGRGMTVLIDSGSGRLASRWEGATDRLIPALARHGVAPVDVDLVVLTHLDFDHAGGTLDLPRAGVAVPQAALDDPGAAGTIVVEQLASGGRIRPLAEGVQPAPGLTVRPAPGHRAGHSVVEVEHALLHLADLVHHPLHVEHPEWDAAFDADPDVALWTRRTELERAAGLGITIVCSHIALPGRVVHGSDGLRWASVST